MTLFKKKEVSVLYKRSKSEKIVFAVGFVVMAVFAFMLMYPYIFGVLSSLKEHGRAYMTDPVSVTLPFYFSNYKKAINSLVVNGHPYPVLLFNSIWYSMLGQLIPLVGTICSTYVVSRYKFKGHNFVYNLVIFTMILPIMSSGASSYRLMYKLGFIESPTILFSSLGSLCSLILYAFFKGIPQDYSEAAEMDGAGHFRIFLQIMLPQVIGGLSVIYISNVIAAWNDYSGPLLYLSKKYPTLATGMYIYEQQIIYSANQPVFFAGALIAAIPPVILFVVLQNTLMTKVYIGGLKG